MDNSKLTLKVIDKENYRKTKRNVDISKVKEKAHPILIQSFLRSGNTMLRVVIENTTSVFTGDDIYFTPEQLSGIGDTPLSCYGLGNESVIENIGIVKSHYPFSNYPQNQFKTQGIVLAIRNPFDCIESFFHFVGSESHNEYIKTDFNIESLIKFCELTIPKYQEFYEYVINTNGGKVPILVNIYEDFNGDKINGTKRLFDFIFKFKLDKEYLGGLTHEDIEKKLNSEEDLKDILEKIVYLPKDLQKNNKFRSIKVNKLYTDDLKEKIITTCYSTLKFFDYIKDLKEMEDTVITKAIEKMEKLEKEDKSIFKYKYDSYKQLDELNKTLFEDFNKYEKQIDRPYAVINSTEENSFSGIDLILKQFWGRLVKE